MGGFGASLCLWSMQTDCEYSTLEEPRTCRTDKYTRSSSMPGFGRAAHVQDRSNALENELQGHKGSPAHGQNAAWAQ